MNKVSGLSMSWQWYCTMVVRDVTTEETWVNGMWNFSVLFLIILCEPIIISKWKLQLRKKLIWDSISMLSALCFSEFEVTKCPVNRRFTHSSRWPSPVLRRDVYTCVLSGFSVHLLLVLENYQVGLKYSGEFWIYAMKLSCNTEIHSSSYRSEEAGTRSQEPLA